MPVMSYADLPTAPSPLPGAHALINGEASATSFDFVDDEVLIRNAATPAQNYCGSLTAAIAATKMGFTRATTAWGFDRLGRLASFASGTPRLVYDPATRITSTTALHKNLGVKALTASTEHTYAAGDKIAISDVGNTSDWMRATVISHVGTLLAVNVTRRYGVKGVASSWVITRSLGYLPEPQRTNLLTRSEELDNAAWTKTRATITANATTAPDGAVTMDKIVETTDTGGHYLQRTTPSLSASTTYVQSVFLKAAERTRFQMAMNADSGSNLFAGARPVMDVDLAAGTLSNQSAGVVRSGIIYCGNGVYWVWMAGTMGGTGGTQTPRFILGDAATFSYTGDGTSGLYAWGFDLQSGAYPTSYIPTTSATVTRNADVLTAALSNLPWSATEGTVTASAYPCHDDTVNQAVLWHIDNASTTMRHLSRSGTAGTKTRNGVTVSSNSVVANLPGTNNQAAARFRESYAWAANDFQFVMNGVSQGTDTNGAVPTGLTIVRFGHHVTVADGNWYAAPIESVSLIPRRLSQAEQIVRTTL